MIPVITYSHAIEGWKIYLRPTIQMAADNMRATHGSRYDRIEREKVTGGVSTLWPVFPEAFSTKEQAEASLKAIR